MSVSRSIFALVDDRDRAYFGRGNESEDQIGFLGDNTRAIFGRSYAAEPDVLVEQLAKDEAIAEADTLLLTVPNQLGVDYNAHVIEAILTHVAPGARAGAEASGESAGHSDLRHAHRTSASQTDGRPRRDMRAARHMATHRDVNTACTASFDRVTAAGG